MRTPALFLLLITLSMLRPSAGAQDGSTAPLVQRTPSISPGGTTTHSSAPGVTTTQRLAVPMKLGSAIQGSTYVPMDNWLYPALDRLHALGYIDTAFLGLRPWTRSSIEHMLSESSEAIYSHPEDETALEIFLALRKELMAEELASREHHVRYVQLENAYVDVRGIEGTPLRDSYHLGQTIVNDYGRPYQEGFNSYSGFTARMEADRFSLFFRGEYQHSPAAAGYSHDLAEVLSSIDIIPYQSNPVQDTIPEGPIAAANAFRVMEATASFHLLDHEISFGKSDHWLSPAKGGSMSWSTNAENIYSLEINRTEPLRIPVLSRLTGPFRYDFFVGSLKGHSSPNDPWVHVEKISLKPTRNLELGFERTAIWGGEGHAPITLHTFLHSFFGFQNVANDEKYSRDDPGARFGSFDFNYRIPFVRDWLSLYCDSEAHDEVNPISAPRRSAVRPGLYLTRLPGLHSVDVRVEGASTDPVSNAGLNGNFLFDEAIQTQGTTNKGFLFTDWMGRDAKGGQAWLTYHRSPNEYVQFMYRNAKVDHNFIPLGATQNDFQISIVKRFSKDVELRAWVQQEEWKAPIYKPGRQSDTAVSAQITWYLKQTKNF